MTQTKAIQVRYEATPNPNTFRFTSDVMQSKETAEYKSAAEAQFSPLAKKLFGFPWCQNIFVGTDFITISKKDWVDWEIIAEPLSEVIAEFLSEGKPLIPHIEVPSETSSKSSTVSDARSSTEAKIIAILENEIRPMVAQDGGDVVFKSFSDGIVSVEMRGSCAGCPSSTMTLKMGIETRLKAAVPEVNEVISV